MTPTSRVGLSVSTAQQRDGVNRWRWHPEK